MIRDRQCDEEGRQRDPRAKGKVVRGREERREKGKVIRDKEGGRQVIGAS